MNKHDTVGIDLVAMNVNDLVVQGAEPLYFTDYYGCSKLVLETAASFVEGVATGCIQANCALVGGETAEMPGMYQKDDYDAAGALIRFLYQVPLSYWARRNNSNARSRLCQRCHVQGTQTAKDGKHGSG